MLDMRIHITQEETSILQLLNDNVFKCIGQIKSNGNSISYVSAGCLAFSADFDNLTSAQT